MFGTKVLDLYVSVKVAAALWVRWLSINGISGVVFTVIGIYQISERFRQ